MDDEFNGLSAVSLVDYPAVERDFLLFDKQDMLFKTNDEKHIISGIALLADTPIYRRNEKGEYYVVFEKETICKLVEKYSKDGLLNSVNLMHRADKFVDKVYMVESLIIDKKRGICPVEFKDVPDGSWYISYFVEDEKLWDEIKKGDWFRGFSVEITAGLELKEQLKKNNLNTNMNKLFKLAKMILKLSETLTDKDILIYNGELEVNTEVFVESEGELVPAENGEYTTEDGTVIVVENGLVTEIRKAEAKEEDPVVTEELEEETPVEDRTEEIEALNAEIEALKAVIAEKDAEIEALKAQVATQEEKLKMSVDTPVAKKSVKVTSKENKALKYFSN